MKKFIIAIIALLLFTSCVETKPTEPTGVIKTDEGPATAIFDEIIEFEYRGHYWIYFKQYNGLYQGYSEGIAHDPDCWCLSDDIEYD